MIRTVAVACVLTAATSVAAAAQEKPVTEAEGKTLNLTAYVELLRSEVRSEKVAIITEVMGFSEAEDKAFWPIYREYDLAMAKLGDERAALIQSYAKSYTTITDAMADSFASRALDLEKRRQEALINCFERVKKALSPRTALRFLQIEHQLLLLIDLQIAASLPVVR